MFVSKRPKINEKEAVMAIFKKRKKIDPFSKRVFKMNTLTHE